MFGATKDYTMDAALPIEPAPQYFTTEGGEKLSWPFPDKPAREVQLRALSKGFGKSGFAYFMRQRLGKTLTAFAEFTILRDQDKVDWMVVICPNSIKESEWVRQIEEVDPYIPICVYHSQAKHRLEYFFSKNKDGGVIIINFESVLAFVNNNGISKFNTLRSYCVVDESTRIKEPKLKSTKAVHELGSFCMYTRILTGKPTANSNADIWSQLKFIRATDRNYYQHKYYFCVMGGYKGKQVKLNINQDVLKREMEPHCYIAEDKYINAFEKVYEPMRHVTLTGELKRMYDEMEKSFLIELGNDIEITAPIALTKYLRLQQISSGIAGDIDGVQHNLVPPSNNPRIQVVKDILESEIDNKVIIPCRFKLSIQNLYNELTKEGYKCLIMQGMMKQKEIDEVKYKFNNEDYTVLIAQLQVLSFGHTLCAQDDKPCDSMIFFENDFSLINRDQSEKRPEKMERKKPISYYDMYASDIDKYMIQKLIEKEDGATALMGYARKHGIFGTTTV